MAVQRPPFSTAIPRQRFRWRGYELVLLGEIENNGPEKYRFILAVIGPGQSQPCLYYSVEQSRRAEREEGLWTLWYHDETGKQLLARADNLEQTGTVLEVAGRDIARRYQLEGSPMPV